MVQISWLVLGGTTIVAAMMAQRSRRAFVVGIWSLALLEIVAGALVNLVYLLQGDDFSTFADGSAFAFVRSTWASLVVPNHWIFIGLLVAFEATMGVLVLRGGTGRRVALWLLVAFHVALLAFSWWYLFWAVPMILAFLLLLEADKEWSSVEASLERAHAGVRKHPAG